MTARRRGSELETALPLFLTAVHEGKLSLEDVRLRMADNVRRIFDLPEQDAYVEVDVDAQWTFDAARSETRAGWSPFDGAPLRGRVERVVLRGEEVVSGGLVLARPGLGRDVRGGEP